MGSVDRFIQDITERVPPPGTDPMDHLRHTTAMFHDSRDEEFVVMASDGVYPEGRTGLTWGDLRELERRLELVEANLDPDWGRT